MSSGREAKVFEDESIYLNQTDAGRKGVFVLLMDFCLPNRWLWLLLWIVRKGSYENFRDTTRQGDKRLLSESVSVWNVMLDNVAPSDRLS